MSVLFALEFYSLNGIEDDEAKELVYCLIVQGTTEWSSAEGHAGMWGRMLLLAIKQLVGILCALESTWMENASIHNRWGPFKVL